MIHDPRKHLKGTKVTDIIILWCVLKIFSAVANLSHIHLIQTSRVRVVSSNVCVNAYFSPKGTPECCYLGL